MLYKYLSVLTIKNNVFFKLKKKKKYLYEYIDVTTVKRDY